MTEPVPTPRYQRIVAAASEAARESGHAYVGAEHLFLAIIRDRDSVPAQVLGQLTSLDEAEADLLAVMASEGYRTSAPFVPPRGR